MKVCLVVVGKYVSGNPEQQVEIHDIPLLQQILQSDVIVFFQQVDIAVFGTPALTGHIRKSVAGSGTDADGIGKRMPRSIKLSSTPQVKTPRIPPPSKTRPLWSSIRIIFSISVRINASKIAFVYDILSIFAVATKIYNILIMMKKSILMAALGLLSLNTIAQDTRKRKVSFYNRKRKSYHFC